MASYYNGSVWNGTVESCCRICSQDPKCAFFINFGEAYEPPACFIYSNTEGSTLSLTPCDTETEQGTVTYIQGCGTTMTTTEAITTWPITTTTATMTTSPSTTTGKHIYSQLEKYRTLNPIKQN